MTVKKMREYYDVIIAGTGVAGLYAALNFSSDVKVLLLSKNTLTLSNSALAQGGVAAVVDTTKDDYKLHIADTLIAGGYKNNIAALEVLVSEGPGDVLGLLKLGVNFDEDESGNLQMTLEGGHSRRRILHHKDSTGFEIINKLLKKVLELPNVDIVENALLCTLNRVDGGFWAGVIVDEVYIPVTCGYTVLCTGGIGQAYQYTTNSAIATGDGITLAYELGARIKDLHLVQFHPTVFASVKGRKRFLISEAVRGEGAIMLNCHHERFMHKYDERGELATRDVVSRSIMHEARRTGSTKFYLDISFKDSDYLKARFPMIYENCLREGVDITTDLIPIFPCQHYLMGGIDVNLQSQSTIDRLYACGECSHTGVHGTNRLASNSLLEALVFSRRAAKDIMERLGSGHTRVRVPPHGIRAEGLPILSGLRTEVRDIMQSAHFVIPNPLAAREGLVRTRKILNILKTSNYALTADYIEAKSLATVATIVLKEVTDQ